MIERLTTVLEIAAIVAVVTGVALIWVPAGLIVLGFCLFALSWSLSR
jgi:hypothetical protein